MLTSLSVDPHVCSPLGEVTLHRRTNAGYQSSKFLSTIYQVTEYKCPNCSSSKSCSRVFGIRCRLVTQVNTNILIKRYPCALTSLDTCTIISSSSNAPTSRPQHRLCNLSPSFFIFHFLLPPQSVYIIPNSPNPFNTSLSTRLNHSSLNLSSPPCAKIAPCKCSLTYATRLIWCTGSPYTR
jgi:hypothetical protein